MVRFLIGRGSQDWKVDNFEGGCPLMHFELNDFLVCLCVLVLSLMPKKQKNIESIEDIMYINDF